MNKSQIFKCYIEINSVKIPIKDNMLNASILCRINKKSFYSYKKLKNTQNELKNLSNKIPIPVEKLLPPLLKLKVLTKL